VDLATPGPRPSIPSMAASPQCPATRRGALPARECPRRRSAEGMIRLCGHLASQICRVNGKNTTLWLLESIIDAIWRASSILSFTDDAMNPGFLKLNYKDRRAKF
jgi:hypothetical protein